VNERERKKVVRVCARACVRVFSFCAWASTRGCWCICTNLPDFFAC